MKVTPQAPFVRKLRGSIGQLRFSELPSGHIVRRPWKITAPATPAQAAHRQAVADSRTLWLSMPGFLELAWHLYSFKVEYSAYGAWNHYNIAALRDGTLTVLTPPNDIYGPVSAVQFAGGAIGEIDATWSYSGPPATCFCDLYSREVGTLSWELGSMCDALDLGDTIPNLEPGAVYEVALTARDYPITRYQESSHAFCQATPIPYEYFPDYVELDPHGHIAPAAYSVVVTDLHAGPDSWLYDDKGVDHFGSSFSHDFVLTVNDMYSSGYASSYSLSNVVEDDLYWAANNSQAVTLAIRSSSGDARLFLINRETGANQQWDPITFETPYYCTFDRPVPTTLRCRFYADEAKTNLLKTLQVAVAAARAYRFIFVVNTYNAGGVGTVDFTLADLNLNEA